MATRFSAATAERKDRKAMGPDIRSADIRLAGIRSAGIR
jgi:hypothetical protein